MPTTYAIPNGRTVMDATAYTATGTGQVVNNSDNGTVGFKPDLVWTKNRDIVADHFWGDTNRGIANLINSNTQSAEYSAPNYYTSFNSNGFTLGSSNYSSGNIIAWQWQAGQGTNTTNTNGTITSTVSANTTAGFSIVTYSGSNTNTTVGHGLGVAPQFIVVHKRASGVGNWLVYHSALGAGQYVFLSNTNAAASSSTLWNNTSPTTSVFSLGANINDTNQSGNTYVAYCWAPVAGFSQFGSYTGNGSTDGPFVYTGFRPKFVMWKRTDTTADWVILDSTRDAYNPQSLYLEPNLSSAEVDYTSSYPIDFLSNGWKLRQNAAGGNANGGTYIYAAFAENPFKYANAR